MATATGSPRVAGPAYDPDRRVILVCGPDGIGKSACIARWCRVHNAVHVSPKREAYKMYAASIGAKQSDLWSSPRREYHAAQVQAYVGRLLDRHKHALDEAVERELRLLTGLVFVDIYSAAQMDFYAPYAPILIHVDWPVSMQSSVKAMMSEPVEFQLENSADLFVHSDENLNLPAIEQLAERKRYEMNSLRSSPRFGCD